MSWNAFAKIGNLSSRSDVITDLVESFTYDDLNRVTGATIVQGANSPVSKTFSYNATGNIVTKSDHGVYSYPTQGASSVRPNAVSSVVTASGTKTYAYDANGNMTSGDGRTLTWTPFNMPLAIAQGASTLTFTYDTEHGRIKQVAPDGTTHYINDTSAGLKSEKFIGASSTRWVNYVYAAGGIAAVVNVDSVAGTTTRYFHKDHLGSTAVITDESGAVVERLAYDAWGIGGAIGAFSGAYNLGMTTPDDVFGFESSWVNARMDYAMPIVTGGSMGYGGTGSVKEGILGAAGGAFNAEMAGWMTTTWSPSSDPNVTVGQVKQAVAMTRWDQVVAKTLVEGGFGGAMSLARGKSVSQGIEKYAFTGLSNEIFNVYIGEAPKWLGPGGPGVEKSPGDAFMRGVNNFGVWKSSEIFLKEGTFLSRVFDSAIPTMSSTSLLHDSWSTITGGGGVCLGSEACPSMMIPAWAVSTGALLRDVRGVR